MRQLAFIGLMMTVGLLGGAFVVSDNRLLAALMGAILGAAAAVVVLAFPRNHDYPNTDTWFRD